MIAHNDIQETIEEQIAESRNGKHRIIKKFEIFSSGVTRKVGSPMAFVAALAIIVIWGITGPLFHFSDTWQLVINTGTTIVTFLMVFLIQQAQNKDSLAIQLKLNELIASEKRASNRLIDVEDLSQAEMEVLKKFYIRLSELAAQENDLFSSHSVDEATGQHQRKYELRQKQQQKENRGQNH